jgi:hypothetical protein
MTGPVRDKAPKGRIWPLEADVVRDAIGDILKRHDPGNSHLGSGARTKMEALMGDELDLVMWVGEDGTVTVRSISVRFAVLCSEVGES